MLSCSHQFQQKYFHLSYYAHLPNDFFPFCILSCIFLVPLLLSSLLLTFQFWFCCFSRRWSSMLLLEVCIHVIFPTQKAYCIRHQFRNLSKIIFFCSCSLPFLLVCVFVGCRIVLATYLLCFSKIWHTKWIFYLRCLSLWLLRLLMGVCSITNCLPIFIIMQLQIAFVNFDRFHVFYSFAMPGFLFSQKKIAARRLNWLLNVDVVVAVKILNAI